MVGASDLRFSLGLEAVQLPGFLKKAQGSFLQAVWCECPLNPLLWTVDLERIRRLANRYDYVVVVDETIGSFANVDVLDIADIVVTSLTKSFNGYADLLAESVVLNPNSRYYTSLKTSLRDSYSNDLYVEDAIQLELNSCDFIRRAAQLISTVEYLADFLHPFASDPSSVVNAVHYPKISTLVQRYKTRMSQPTNDFTPSYGYVRKGPSLGGHVTLTQPYVQMVLQKQKKWTASHGLRQTIVQLSVGLEDKDDLLQRVKSALAIAEKMKSGQVF
ncbi:pyridoxal phosphate-dependent transferase [Aspergillus sergii]|uniref:Pyridoxal phosphate-dependent transferase n=1 Tax=Aspergillus sergii TaxID=1034303 RepID=A0A5N6X8Y7_9EURO|nr:pyridoxal phosphate-dependent transferase [Aspergillus sergii]